MSKLNERSKQIRRDTYALSKANGGYHYGGCFSAVEIMIALFDHVLQDDDAFILSKGHACWPLYVLLREKGLNPKLEGHPTYDPSNGIEASTGSLGHGFPIGVGKALARKIQGRSGRIFVLMGDGECQEGTTWESMLIATHYKLDNLIIIVDQNDIQGSGFSHEILKFTPVLTLARSLGWDSRCTDGHDIFSLVDVFNIGLDFCAPRLISAATIKGKGVSFMENNPEWHARWPNAEEEAKILEELG